MRICIVSLNIVPYFQSDRCAQYGGAEVQAAFLADALASTGHDVCFVVSDLDPETPMSCPAENAFDTASGAPGLRFFHPRMTGIFKAFDRVGADVYYQRNAGMITGLTALYCRWRGKVFVYGAGSNTDFSFRDSRVQGLRDKVLHSVGLRLSHGIVVQNRTQEDACRERFDKRVRVVPNGVSLSDGDSGGLSDPTDTIVWVGALRRVKRPELFIELARRMPDHRFLLIGGSIGTETEFADKIRNTAEAVENIEVAGHIPHEEVLGYIRRAAILVNTSAVEGFPNVYLEAWKYGVPVVSFNDVDRLIEHESLGAICQDLDGMEVALSALMAEATERAAVGVRARAIVSERFSASALAKQYLSFFEELLDTDASRRR